MSNYVPVQVSRPVYAKLQRLAVLTGDVSSAIERLYAHWESSAASSEQRSSRKEPEAQYWHSSRGDVLRIGEPLQGTDNGKIHHAKVERDGVRYNGVVYGSLSAAARAVKHARGLQGPSASTDGRKFWKIRDAKTNRWVQISSLRPAHRIDTDALLAELEAMK